MPYQIGYCRQHSMIARGTFAFPSRLRPSALQCAGELQKAYENRQKSRRRRNLSERKGLDSSGRPGATFQIVAPRTTQKFASCPQPYADSNQDRIGQANLEAAAQFLR